MPLPLLAIGAIASGVGQAAGQIGGSIIQARAQRKAAPSTKSVYRHTLAGMKAEARGYPLLARAEVEAARIQEPALARLAMDLEREYLPQRTELAARLGYETAAEFQPKYASLARELARITDPEGMAAREAMARTLQTELGAAAELAAGRLTPEQRAAFEQSIRGAQAARGNVWGAGPTFNEAEYLAYQGERLRQQRLANAMGIASSLGAEAPAMRAVEQELGAAYGFSAQPWRSQDVGGMALSTMGQMANFETARANYMAGIPNPWAQGLGMIGGQLGQWGWNTMMQAGQSYGQQQGWPSSVQGPGGQTYYQAASPTGASYYTTNPG